MTTPATPGAAAQVGSYIAAVASARLRILQAVATMWARLPGYLDADVERFIATVVPLVLGGERQVASLTHAYLTRLVADATGAAPATAGLDLETVTGKALRGVDPKRVYERPFVQARTEISRGKTPKQATESGARRLHNIAATDLQLATTHTARATFGEDGRIVGYRRVLTGAENCGMCVVASTQRYRIRNLMPIHPGCVVGSTVTAAQKVEALTRRRYTGELTVIRTASGNELTVTPNHPVLTDKGWVPAHLLSEGDCVIRSRGHHGANLVRPDKDQGIAVAEDIWRAAYMHPTSTSACVPLAAEDFHGDGANGKVDVVRPNSYLAPVADVPFVQPRSELSLVLRGGGRTPFSDVGALDHLLHGCGGAPASGGSAFDVNGSFFGGHTRHAFRHDVHSRTQLNASIREMFGDRFSGDVEVARDSRYGVTSDVPVADHVAREIFADTTRFDPSGFEFSGEGLVVHAERGRSLLHRLAGEVELDSVVFVGRADCSASHVYNLQTAEGWYSANGLIVSNCDCAISPIVGDSDPGQAINTAVLTGTAVPVGQTKHGVAVYSGDNLLDVGDLLEPIHQAIQSTFGISDRGGRDPIDYRKVMTVHHHGEYGPTLGVLGDAHTGPGDIP